MVVITVLQGLLEDGGRLFEKFFIGRIGTKALINGQWDIFLYTRGVAALVVNIEGGVVGFVKCLVGSSI